MGGRPGGSIDRVPILGIRGPRLRCWVHTRGPQQQRLRGSSIQAHTGLCGCESEGPLQRPPPTVGCPPAPARPWLTRGVRLLKLGASKRPLPVIPSCARVMHCLGLANLDAAA